MTQCYGVNKLASLQYMHVHILLLINFFITFDAHWEMAKSAVCTSTRELFILF